MAATGRPRLVLVDDDDVGCAGFDGAEAGADAGEAGADHDDVGVYGLLDLVSGDGFGHDFPTPLDGFGGSWRGAGRFGGGLGRAAHQEAAGGGGGSGGPADLEEVAA